MAELQITLIPHWEVKHVWDKVSRMLKLATDQSQGRYNLSDVKAKLEANEFQLWVIFEEPFEVVAAVTSSFATYPQCHCLCGQFLGGDRMDEWKDKFCVLFDSWGRDNKCDIVEFTGRAGWGKVLAPNGYREVFRTYQRDLK